MYQKRASLENAREKALPILVSEFKKRHKMRSGAEVKYRAPEKAARDRHASKKPHLCTI
jgi:hypothetical protein